MWERLRRWLAGMVPDDVSASALLTTEDYLTTLLQIVPSAVVAVFVFAAGTVFVIAQVIAAPLGSREIEELLASSRGRRVLFFGVALLVASLSLAVVAPDVDDGLPFWTKAAASVLAAATVGYAISAVILIFRLSQEFMQPEQYATRLSSTDRDRPLDSEQAYRRLRTIRQWLRTACASGESRDIIFALDAFRKLVERYADHARTERRRELAATEAADSDAGAVSTTSGQAPRSLRRDRPREYADTAAVVKIHWRRLRPGSSPGPRGKGDLPGWFGDELGRAAVRSVETGIRTGTLLVRDADRIQGTMKWAARCFVDGEPPLLEEAGYLVDRIAEIGLFRQLAADELYRTWCTYSSVDILTDLAQRFRDVGGRKLPLPPLAGETGSVEDHHTLQERVLVGWLLIKYDEYLTRSSPRRGSTTPAAGATPSGGEREPPAGAPAVPPLVREHIETVMGTTVDGSDPDAAPADPNEPRPLYQAAVQSAFEGLSISVDVVKELARNRYDDLSWLQTLQLQRSDGGPGAVDLEVYVEEVCTSLGLLSEEPA